MQKKNIGLLIGFLIFITILILPAPTGMTNAAWKTTAVTLLMTFFWIMEVFPIYITALLPIILFPVLNISSIEAATTPFGHHLIFLFLGGFLLAQGIQKWDLHKRIALKIISFMGISPSKIIAGFMIGSAFLSMWLSNTATALMMLPIALSVISVADSSKSLSSEDQKKFSISLLLSIAYSCSIGGVATLIGTPPNSFMAAYMKENYQITIDFAKWMLIGLPFVVISLPVAYLILTKLIFPVSSDLNLSRDIINDELKKLGKMSREAKIVQIVFLLTAFLWIFRPIISNIIPNISDASISIFGAILLFIIPARNGFRILEWEDAKKISWGVLILFGGGLSLAQGISNSKLSEWIATTILGYFNLPPLIIALLIVTGIIFLTELTSNLATIASFLPIIASIAVGININPLVIVIPATLAASCAFMLPIATPPNAIIFSSNEVSINNMAKSGLILNIVFIIIITILSISIGSLVFDY